ncbi:MAG: TerB family tellurite resistance protein [Rhodospirillaceae bacterium]
MLAKLKSWAQGLGAETASAPPPGPSELAVATALLLAEAATLVGDLELFGMTGTSKQSLAPEHRVAIMEMLWEVVYADGQAHYFEASLARRVAGLLHVPDRDAGAARKRVLARLEQKTDPA